MLASISLLIVSCAIALAILILAIAWARRITTVIEIEEEAQPEPEPDPVVSSLQRELAALRTTRFGPPMGTEPHPAPQSQQKIIRVPNKGA